MSKLFLEKDVLDAMNEELIEAEIISQSIRTDISTVTHAVIMSMQKEIEEWLSSLTKELISSRSITSVKDLMLVEYHQRPAHALDTESGGILMARRSISVMSVDQKVTYGHRKFELPIRISGLTVH